jgi:DNA-binding transcriptional ArsR family regulator
VDAVFKALADPTRRSLLDELYERDGQTLSALEQRLPMTRFGVMKHLKVLEQAGLVVTKKRGREKLHFLNPVPIRLVHDRWVSKYAEPWASALSELKTQLEEDDSDGHAEQRQATLDGGADGEGVRDLHQDHA